MRTSLGAYDDDETMPANSLNLKIFIILNFIELLIYL